MVHRNIPCGPMDSHSHAYFSGMALFLAYKATVGVLDIHDIMFAHNVTAYIAHENDMHLK